MSTWWWVGTRGTWMPARAATWRAQAPAASTTTGLAIGPAVRLHAFDRAVPDGEAGHGGARQEGCPQPAGRDGVAAGHLGRLEVDVARGVQHGAEPPGLQEGVPAVGFLGGDHHGVQPEALPPAGLLLQDGGVLGPSGRLEAARADDVQRLAGVGGEPEQPLHGPGGQAGHEVRGAQRRGVAGGPGRGLGRQRVGRSSMATRRAPRRIRK